MSACPISCSSFDTTSAPANPSTPSQLMAPRNWAATVSHCRAASSMPTPAASALSATNHRL
ncbi:hypothetical protein D9M72_263670 [compost metagenome]